MTVIDRTGTRSADAPADRRRRGRVAQSVHDSLVIAGRNLIRMSRMPELVVFGLIQPIMCMVLFAYVFGGSIDVAGDTDPETYRRFLMAGTFAQTVTFATAGASSGVAEDMSKGLVDRFRSLPMARGAVLTGRTLSDLVQTAFTLLVMASIGFIVGWRLDQGILSGLAGFGLLLLLGYAFSWIGALIGLSVRSPEAATSGGLIWAFPMIFVSNAFVPSENMTGVVRHIAEWNPFSTTVQACRELFGNLPPGYPVPDAWPMRHPVLASVLWSLLILAVFRTLAVRRYRSAAG